MKQAGRRRARWRPRGAALAPAKVLACVLASAMAGALAVTLPGSASAAAAPAVSPAGSAAGPAGASASAEPAALPCPPGVSLRDYQEPGGQLLHVGAVSCPLGASNWRLLDVPFTTGYVQPNASPGPGRPQVDQPGVRVILPADYLANPGKRYPVLYLLHGAMDTYQSWTGADADGLADKGTAYTDVTANAAANSGLIVVMPSGSALGLYTDWYGASVANKRPMFESHHIRQLVPWVDQNFRTWPARSGRAIAGLSMGGYGALMYAKRHPTLFSAVAAFSAVADIEDTGYGPFPRLTAGRVLQAGLALTGQAAPGAIFGPGWNGLTGEGSGPNWRAHNPVRDPEQYRGLDLTLFVGANDVAAPRSSRQHCELRQYQLGVAIGEAVFESADCIGNERLDQVIRRSAVLPASSYWYGEFPGRLHNFKAWDEYLATWLPRLMMKVKAAG